MDDKPIKTKGDYSAPAPNSEERNSEEFQNNLLNEQVTVIPPSGPEIVRDAGSNSEENQKNLENEEVTITPLSGPEIVRDTVERNFEENQKNSANEQVTITPLSGPEIVHDESSERTHDVEADPEDLKAQLRALLKNAEPGKTETNPGAYDVRPNDRSTVGPNETNIDDIEEADVVPVDLVKNDDPEKSKSSNSQKFVITEATKVEDICVSAEKIDPEKEKIERELEVKKLVEKEREHIFKNDSATRKNKLMIIFLIVIILAATALTIGIVVGNKSTSSSPVSAPPKPSFPPVMDLRGDNIKVETILDEGRSFHVPVADFMLPFDSLSPDENGKIKSSLRVFNSRTNTSKAIMVEKKDDIVHGWYNPTDSGQPGDFQVGDILSAIDYQVFTEQKCNRVPFTVEIPTAFALERDATDIKIGREGIVGAENGNVFQDFDVLVEVAEPVSKLWSDAVNSRIEILQQGSWANWPQQVSSDNNISSILPFPEPLSGKFRVCFKGVTADDLNGLVSKMDGGGLHIALCA